MSSDKLETSFYRTLPSFPHLTHLKDEAKELKARFNNADEASIALVEFHLGRKPSRIKLADAQFVLSRAYGFKSWPRLKAFAESHALKLEERGELLLKTLFTGNETLLRELYSQRETLSALNLFTAAALGDFGRVSEAIRERPDIATATGGIRHTQAITYAAHAPFSRWDDSFAERQQRIVKLLLANGADPNSSAVEEGRGKAGDGRLSALYGCCRAPGNPKLAEILLRAGASPNDGESVYHASELEDTRCLELLFAAGVDKEDREYCIRRALDIDNPKAVEIYLKHGTDPNHLDWALFRNRSFEVIQLLVEYGADLDLPCPPHWLLYRIEGLTPVQVAERNGDNKIVAYLLAKGARDSRTPRDLLIGACARADANTARRLLEQFPETMSEMNQRDHGNLAAFARAGRLETVKLMLDLGFNIEARADDLDATALLYAATTGDVPMLRLLISRGARLDVKHKYDGDPLGTAIYSAAHFPGKRSDFPGSVDCLINAGAPVDASYLKFAMEDDLHEIAEVLKSHGVGL